jgi:hypothetical protein
LTGLPSKTFRGMSSMDMVGLVIQVPLLLFILPHCLSLFVCCYYLTFCIHFTKKGEILPRARGRFARHDARRAFVPRGAGEAEMWGGDPCGCHHVISPGDRAPSSLHRQGRGRPQGSPPFPTPPPPLRRREAFSPKTLPVRGGVDVVKRSREC